MGKYKESKSETNRDVDSAESLLKPLGGHPNVRVEECPCSTGLNNNEGKKPNTQGMDQFADEP